MSQPIPLARHPFRNSKEGEYIIQPKHDKKFKVQQFNLCKEYYVTKFSVLKSFLYFYQIHYEVLNIYFIRRLFQFSFILKVYRLLGDNQPTSLTCRDYCILSPVRLYFIYFRSPTSIYIIYTDLILYLINIMPIIDNHS